MYITLISVSAAAALIMVFIQRLRCASFFSSSSFPELVLLLVVLWSPRPLFLDFSRSLLVIAGPAINPVQVFRTLRVLHWEFLRLWTGFELPSSCANLP
jgi:hypothetical protein